MLPWECSDLYGDITDGDDIFRLPTRATAHRDKPYRLTIFLPTRHNIMKLINAIESVSDNVEVAAQIS